MRLKQSIYFIACVAAYTLPMAAQPREWFAVRAIMPGTEIRIDGPRPDRIRGKFLSATADSLVLMSGTGEEMFSLPQIKHVWVKEKGHRGQHALIGLGVGAGFGLIVGALGDANCGVNCTIPRNFGKEALPPFFGGLGALIGAVIPTGGWRQVYKQ